MFHPTVHQGIHQGIDQMTYQLSLYLGNSNPPTPSKEDHSHLWDPKPEAPEAKYISDFWDKYIQGTEGNPIFAPQNQKLNLNQTSQYLFQAIWLLGRLNYEIYNNGGSNIDQSLYMRQGSRFENEPLNWTLLEQSLQKLNIEITDPIEEVFNCCIDQSREYLDQYEEELD